MGGEGVGDTLVQRVVEAGLAGVVQEDLHAVVEVGEEGRGAIVWPGKLYFSNAGTVETICREARNLNSLAASRDRGFSVDLS